MSSPLYNQHDAVPAAEPRPILLRAYAAAAQQSRGGPKAAFPEQLCLFFDTETRTDETQRLRFGTYQVWAKGKKRVEGLFFDPDAVTAKEKGVLTTEAQARSLELLTADEFVDKHFFGVAMSGGSVVGFNLPFDISRLAMRWDRARRVTRTNKKTKIKKVDRSMVGGFTLALSQRNDRPHVRVKHLSRRSAFVNMTRPEEPEGQRRARGGSSNEEGRGFFVDVKTLAAALTSKSYRLGTLAEELGVKHKGVFTDYDRAIDPEFIDYALDDTEVTRQCYEALMDRYARHGLSAAPAHRIYSEASLGKAYLREMNIRPWREVQPDFDPSIVGAIMSSYFGGRAEVHRRREIVSTLYCDFASMYPTVCTLMDLWKFVIAKGMETRPATAETQTFLDSITLSDLRSLETWLRMPVLVRVLPKADIFPVRARYGEEPMATIGLNYLTSEQPLWFTLADCVASKLLTGKAPQVVEAISFSPLSAQEHLNNIKIGGKQAYAVDPAKDDFYKRVIDLRRSVKRRHDKAKGSGVSKQEVSQLYAEQLGLKILANATSYGIFIELNVEDADGHHEAVELFASEGPRSTTSNHVERPGAYFHPLLGTLITGAARLMLALTERLLIDESLDWAFCDTDSMAFAAPTSMGQDEFAAKVASICSWFEALNPYEEKGSILDVEQENYRSLQGIKRLEPLFCAAISAKRYALFNIDESGKPIIRKASAHGLGHFLAPYGDDDGESAPDCGVRLWQEDMWKAIIRSLQSDNPMRLPLDWHAALTEPAASQYSASTPDRLMWFRSYNAGKAPTDQVRPFNFMLEFHGRKPDELSQQPELFDGLFKRKPHPVAPYNKQPASALEKVWDRKTRCHVPRHWLRTYADALRNYHIHPETKALNGKAGDHSPTKRRHILVDAIEDIGKEANRWDDDEPILIEDDHTVSYGVSPDGRKRMIEAILSVKPTHLAAAARVTHHAIPRDMHQALGAPDKMLRKLFEAASLIESEQKVEAEADAEVLTWLASEMQAHGLTDLARTIGTDPSNLRKIIEGSRRIPKQLRRRWEAKRVLGTKPV